MRKDMDKVLHISLMVILHLKELMSMETKKMGMVKNVVKTTMAKHGNTKTNIKMVYGMEKEL